MEQNTKRLGYWTTWGTLSGAVLGIIFGWYGGTTMLAFKWMGDLFLSALKFIVLPLVMTAMVVGVSGLGDVRKLGRFGGLTIVYFLTTTAISVFIGIILVLFIQPGAGMMVGELQVPERILAKSNFGFGDFILSFLGGGPENKHPNLFYSLTHMEMLPVVLFSVVLGCVLTMCGESGQAVLNIFRGLYDAVMIIVKGIILFAPLGVFGLVAGKIASLGGGAAVLGEIQKVGMYSGTVILGLMIHGIIVLPVILFFIGKVSPLTYVKGMSEALLTAFSTASSAATLPVTTKNVIQKNKVSEKVATFVLPVGATLNMDGTALYEGVAVIFIAQSLGIPLDISQIFIVFVMSVIAGMAAAAIPEAGLVTMVIILQTLNLPIEAIGLLLAVDWFLDRCRTTVNVWGDSVGTAILERLGQAHPKIKFEAL